MCLLKYLFVKSNPPESPSNKMPSRISLGLCSRIIKYLMFGFNVIIWILAFVILSMGIYVRADPTFSEALASKIPNVYTGAYLLIVVGLIAFVIGFLGCCGAIQENQCMLFSYFISLFLVFSFLMAAGLWASASKTKMQLSVMNMLRKTLLNYKEGSKNEETIFMDYVQNEIKCCGVNGAPDYFAQNDPIPASCGQKSTFIARQGCYEALMDMLRSNMDKIYGVGIGIGIIIIIGMVLSMMLCCALKEVNG